MNKECLQKSKIKLNSGNYKAWIINKPSPPKRIITWHKKLHNKNKIKIKGSKQPEKVGPPKRDNWELLYAVTVYQS